jgi:DNA-binding NtrC family response regulator
VIFMTAYGTVQTAVEAMKHGAFDYITKPFGGDVLLATVKRAVEHGRLLKENQILRASGTPAGTLALADQHAMIGDGPAMSRFKERLACIADSHGTVLISGESGSGKEVAARWIHEHSPRARMPFLAINCAALATSLLESELFGHEKGAFTGADRLRKGRFELADGGTLLLDEISEIAPGIQAKLLRVLQERCFERVGSSTSRAVDVRVIATTNRHLPAEVARGSFRQDLFFRLSVLPLTMPPLRDHVEDVPELAQHFLEHVARREGKAVKALDPEAIELLKHYPWPGNVRELQNICERAAVLTTDGRVHASLVAPWLNGHAGAAAPATAVNGWNAPAVRPLAPAVRTAAVMEVPPGGGATPSCPGIICDGNLTLADVEREVIVATLQRNEGHRQRSATALGIGVRTLGLKLKKWKEQRLVAETL